MRGTRLRGDHVREYCLTLHQLNTGSAAAGRSEHVDLPGDGKDWWPVTMSASMVGQYGTAVAVILWARGIQYEEKRKP